MHPATPLRVLVVDDDVAVRRSLARVMARAFETHTAASPEEALEALAREPFDVVLSDQDMLVPGDGVALLVAIAERWPATRRFLTSGRTPGAEVAGLIARGVIEAFVEKPFGAAALRERLGGWLR